MAEGNIGKFVIYIAKFRRDSGPQGSPLKSTTDNYDEFAKYYKKISYIMDISLNYFIIFISTSTACDDNEGRTCII